MAIWQWNPTILDTRKSIEVTLAEIVEPLAETAETTDLWPPEIQFLINWFLKLEPREIAPFYLEPHIRVADPVKFFESLHREIKAGPRAPRARHGALQDDLKNLRAKLN